MTKANRPSTWRLALGLVGFLALASGVTAQEWMRSDDYTIQFGTFSSTGGTKSGGGYTLTDTVGQAIAGEFNQNGYYVKAGFQYLYTIPQFRFRILSTRIDLGELSADTFAEGTHDIVITTRGSGYTLAARADRPLRIKDDGPYIPQTACNTGCSPTAAGIWNATNRYGFGFNVMGTNRSVDFTNASYFRPFSNSQASEAFATIASTTNVVKDDVLTITYRANINGSQEAGSYSTGVSYRAVPTY